MRFGVLPSFSPILNPFLFFFCFVFIVHLFFYYSVSIADEIQLRLRAERTRSSSSFRFGFFFCIDDTRTIQRCTHKSRRYPTVLYVRHTKNESLRFSSDVSIDRDYGNTQTFNKRTINTADGHSMRFENVTPVAIA